MIILIVLYFMFKNKSMNLNKSVFTGRVTCLDLYK